MLEKPIGAALDHELVDPGTPDSRADEEIERFVERRHEQRIQEGGAERDAEMAWKASVRAYHAKQDTEEAHSRIVMLKHLRQVYASRSYHYDRLIRSLETNQPKGAA